MVRFGKRFAKPGTAPGTLRPPEVRRVEEVSITVMEYGPDRVDEWQTRSVDEVLGREPGPAPDRAPGEAPGRAAVRWIDVVGLHDVEMLQSLGDHFGLHPLALEDVLNTGQRPKLESYRDHLFVVLRMIHPDPGQNTEQLSLFFGEGFVLTFQEAPGDVFEGVRKRIRHGLGRIRRMGSDYLAYALTDSVVDHLFPVLENLGERLEELEEEVIRDPDRKTVGAIHSVRKELLTLRRAAWPEREVVSALERSDSPLVQAETRVFLRDCYDHTIQILDMVETYRDLAASLLDLYLSSVSNRTNEVMRVLTVLASIFIPLTFMAGVYGMNFDPEAGPWSMPELDWAWGYPAFWGISVVIAAVLLIYFRRKDWL